MTHSAINQARKILQWAAIAETDLVMLAVIEAGKTGDVDAALGALDMADLGALSYLRRDLRAKWAAEQSERSVA